MVTVHHACVVSNRPVRSSWTLNVAAWEYNSPFSSTELVACSGLACIFFQLLIQCINLVECVEGMEAVVQLVVLGI